MTAGAGLDFGAGGFGAGADTGRSRGRSGWWAAKAVGAGFGAGGAAEVLETAAAPAAVLTATFAGRAAAAAAACCFEIAKPPVWPTFACTFVSTRSSVFPSARWCHVLPVGFAGSPAFAFALAKSFGRVVKPPRILTDAVRMLERSGWPFLSNGVFVTGCSFPARCAFRGKLPFGSRGTVFGTSAGRGGPGGVGILRTTDRGSLRPIAPSGRSASPTRVTRLTAPNFAARTHPERRDGEPVHQQVARTAAGVPDVLRDCGVYASARVACAG